MGAWINAAYAAGAATGVEIYIPATNPCVTYTTPIVLNTLHKPVTLRGAGNPATCLNYTPTTGIAIEVDIGAQGRMNVLEDFQLSGPGVGTSTTGLQIGGTNDSGTELAQTNRMLISSFGTGMTLVGANSFKFAGYHMQLNDNGQNFIDATGQENNAFYDSLFSIDTPGTTGTVANCFEVSGSSDWNLYGSSFDNCQLSLASNAIVHMLGGHMENPGMTSYDFFTSAGLELDLHSVLFNQDNASAFANQRFGTASTGTLHIFGGTAFSALNLNVFVALTGTVNFSAYGLYLDSNFVGGGLYSTSSSGHVVACPYDESGDCEIDNQLNVGSLVSTGQITSSVASGTAPFSVASGTRVATLSTGGNPVLRACGSSATCSNTGVSNGYLAFGTVTLSGGTRTVTGLPFANSTWTCVTSDITTPGNGSNMVEATSTTATVTGTGSDVISYQCPGN
jgi:hypothetical protein